MAWVDLFDYISEQGEDYAVSGMKAQYYWGSTYTGHLFTPFPNFYDAFVAWDYGCGPEPQIAWLPANTEIDMWQWYYGGPFSFDVNTVLVQNDSPNSSTTSPSRVLFSTSYIPPGSRLRARAVLFGNNQGSGSNYKEVYIPLGYSSNLTDVYDVEEVTSIVADAYFEDFTLTDWAEFVHDNPARPYVGMVQRGAACSGSFSNFAMEWQIWIPELPPEGFHVYELDRGWSFDGAYIPHYIEMNWYFGDDPIHYHSVQKIRIHGMSKGLAQLTVATNGMQTDYERDFTEPQIVDLPRNPKHISTELIPETNYTDSANRGLSIQMKFEGRNRDLTKPEPQHVLQVLAVQSSPAGTGSRSN